QKPKSPQPSGAGRRLALGVVARRAQPHKGDAPSSRLAQGQAALPPKPEVILERTLRACCQSGLISGLLVVAFASFAQGAANDDPAQSKTLSTQSTPVEDPRSTPGITNESDVIRRALEEIRRKTDSPQRGQLSDAPPDSAETETGESFIGPRQPPREVPVDPINAFVPSPPEPPASIDPSPPTSDSESAISRQLTRLEDVLTVQRQRELEAIRSSNRTTLLVAGLFATVGIFGILLTAALVLRAMNRFSEVALSHAQIRTLGSGHAAAGQWAELPPPESNSAEQSRRQFLGSIESLERRLRELEQSGTNPLNAPPNAPAGTFVQETSAPHPASAESDLRISELLNTPKKGFPKNTPPSVEDTETTALWLGKGQSLMKLGDPEEALVCFETAGRLDPGNVQAMLHQGMALEKLHRLEAAIRIYDQALALDNSLSAAYLQKGHLCNRLQRYEEAVVCFEKAFRA
ncbi:MAG TPA: tetratricopeptide repeat protein, partial [Methylomirabilota bacterium]|nr:tetratricopeptide repeat protein [Methylomirabilota bacterium]